MRLCAVCLAVTTACREQTVAHHGYQPDAAITVDGACDATHDGATNDGSTNVPVRRALAVITDFADTRLESWTGPGFRSEADVRAQLDQMSAHWAFLSHDTEQMQWDIIRVQLPQAFTSDAFPGSNEFRDEVIRLARQQINAADYDFDHDNIIDTVWIIASTNGRVVPWLLGGTTRNDDANNFVDGQDSLSVRSGATGNFNHEVGHTRGLRDLYGDFSTIAELSDMSNSWPVPPPDFSAYDRIHIGWETPVVLAPGAHTIDVPDANTAFASFEVPTARPEEYFLIEYRRRPASGFGSVSSFDYNGIVVYHVFEASDQGIDPPLLKVEPADGVIFAQAPQTNDVFFPGNTAMVLPNILRTYVGGDEVFRIVGVRAGQLDVIVSPPGLGSTPNLIANPGVESGTQGWITGGYQPDLATFAWANIGANGSQHSLFVASTMPNDVEWSTHLTGLPPNRSFYMCGMLRGVDVGGFEGAGAGANISISGTFVRTSGLYGTFDFTQACTIVVGDASTTTDVACRLGGLAAVSTGQIWCDNISYQLLDRVF